MTAMEPVDPIDLHEVPEQERLDVDEGPGANALDGGDDTDDLDLYRTELRGDVVEFDLG